MSEIVFSSVKDAVRWSEEVALLQNMRGTLGRLISKPGTGNITRSDAIDIAQTITAITASSKPYKGQALKAVYAGHSKVRDCELAIGIAGVLLTLEESKQKLSNQMISLGLSTVQAKRAKELYGDRYPIKRMAHDVGVSRERFCKGECWKVLRRAAGEQLVSWLDLGEREVRAELVLRGWMV